ncbi:MAG: hypothetical protein MRZ79_13945 [Bacteroidia bacterium]|nr:hypothetical protein [Bacteroidia bacterium]
MPDYSTYSNEKLVQILENKADYQANAIEEVLEEWKSRDIKPKNAKKLAEEIVRGKIRSFLSRKSRLTFRPQNMLFPESHFLSKKAVSRLFGEEYKNWKERKKMFGSNNPFNDASLL